MGEGFGIETLMEARAPAPFGASDGMSNDRILRSSKLRSPIVYATNVLHSVEIVHGSTGRPISIHFLTSEIERLVKTEVLDGPPED
jgi:hypothetical protein